MKRILSLFCIIAVLLFLVIGTVSGCGKSGSRESSPAVDREAWSDYGTEGLASVTLKLSNPRLKEKTTDRQEDRESLLGQFQKMKYQQTSLKPGDCEKVADIVMRWDDGDLVRISVGKVLMTEYAMGIDGVCREYSEEDGVVSIENAKGELLQSGMISQKEFAALESELEAVYQRTPDR